MPAYTVGNMVEAYSQEQHIPVRSEGLVVPETAVIVQAALHDIQQRHGDKAYHNVDHTLTVMRRTRMILEYVRALYPDLVADRDIDRGYIASAWHDSEQEGEERDGMWVRFAPQNEYRSGFGAIEAMRMAAPFRGEPSYTQDDMDSVMIAVCHSVPAWDVHNRTVYQPLLSAQSPMVARALAYADIGSALLDGPAALIADSNNLFIEDNIGIVSSVRSGNVDSHEKEAIRRRIVAWTRLQVGFVMGRLNRLDQELAGLPEDLQGHLKKDVFVYRDEPLIAAAMQLRNRKDMPYDEIVKDVGILR